MELILKDYKEGSQAIVFLNRKNNLAYKVFKSFKHPSNFDKFDFNENDFNEWKRKIFKSEVKAYINIFPSSIAEYFSNCHDNAIIVKIFDENGSDISSHFLLDCIITLDLFPGESFKQSEIREECLKLGTNLNEIFEELSKIHVNFYIDSSVFITSKGIKIIDIATNDFADFQPPL